MIWDIFAVGLCVIFVVAMVFYMRGDEEIFRLCGFVIVVIAFLLMIFASVTGKGGFQSTDNEVVCPQCDVQIEDEYTFCLNCGTEVKEKEQ